MENQSQLTNVPSFTFYQGEWGEGEKPIIVNFYNGTIEFDQQDNSTILLNEENFERFVKSVRLNFKNSKLLRK